MTYLVQLLLTALLAAAPQAAAPELVTVFEPHHADVLAYREPALVRTSSGTLIAVAEAHRDLESAAPWHVDLALRTSGDDGATWSEERLVVAFDSDEAATRPSLLATPSGRVFLFYTFGAFDCDWHGSAPGTNIATDPRTLQVYVMHSDDDGATWSEPRGLNPEVKAVDWEAISTSSGNGIATSTGRLVQPAFVRGAGGGIGARNLISDDGGQTWTTSQLAGEETEESCVVELADGTLLQNLTPVMLAFPRTHPKRRPDAIKWRLLARSEDGRNFEALEHDLRLPDSNFGAAMVRRAPVEGDPRDLIVFANPATPAGRLNLTLRWSENEGETWAGSQVIEPGPSGASCLSFVGDHSVGILFERGEERFDEQIAFTRIGLGALSSSASLLDADGTPRADYPDLWTWFDAHKTATLGEAGSLKLEARDRSTAAAHDLGTLALGRGALQERSLNRRDVARFSGNLAIPQDSSFGELTGELTILLVARVGSVRVTNHLFDGTGATRLGLRSTPATEAGAHARWELGLRAGEHTTSIPSGEVVPRDFLLHTIVLRAGNVKHFIDGGLAGSGELDPGIAFGLEGLVLGTNGEANAPASCDVAELLVFGRALSGADRKAVESYLAAKFRL